MEEFSLPPLFSRGAYTCVGVLLDASAALILATLEVL